MADRPIVVLIEWNAPEMSPAEAENVAEQSKAVFDATPGLLDARFFGDFESGTHCFLLTWKDRDSMERYMASEAMHAVRGSAAPYVAGKPTRRIFVEYGDSSVAGRGG